MLVLTSMEGQKIYVGKDIMITAVECHHGKVRLGIDAQKSVPILRETLSEEAVMGVKRRAAQCE